MVRPFARPVARPVALAAGLAALTATAALAQGAPDPIATAIKARQGLMDLFAVNLGPLGAMAQGKMDYDAARASTAATNLAALAHLDTTGLWPEGSDEMMADKTRALPAIWDKPDTFAGHFSELATAADAMAGAAGTDLASLQAAMGALGGACGGCHKAFRAPQ